MKTRFQLFSFLILSILLAWPVATAWGQDDSNVKQTEATAEQQAEGRC